jgi:vanadium chloroperoxidase
VQGASDARLAVAAAAITVLERQYTRPDAGIALAATDQLNQCLRQMIGRFPDLDTLSSSYRFGIAVGNAVTDLLEIKPNEPGVSQGNYRPTPGPYRFDDDPTNPVRLVPVNVNDPNGPKRAVRIYHAPFYGLTAKRLAVQMEVDGHPTEHLIADPPGYRGQELREYVDSVNDTVRMGGAPALNATRRRPDQTTGGYFWAYDGSNLIGTPPRLYNQILRQIAWSRKPGTATSEATNADFARLLAVSNAAMADAGIFSWQEKYHFEFWRPLSGVRQDPNGAADPFFLTLGAPSTNTNSISFKPPFPAYPSGHATFGGAVFQAARLHYRKRNSLGFAPDEPDDIAFEIVSDELNGINRDLQQPYDPNQPITDQPGIVRTRVVRRFPSLWAAIFDNAISRVWLGVHWRFDAFSAKDVYHPSPDPSTSLYQINSDGTTAYQDPANIRYRTTGPRVDRPGQLYPIGGVPLGMGIADDVFQGNLKPTPPNKQPTGRNTSGDLGPHGQGEQLRVQD